jgi:hypothetical protein
MKKFKQLDEFERGYIEAMFFTECHCDNPELENKGFDDLAPEALRRIIDDCAKFHEENFELLMCVSDNLEKDGIDFWLTRNGHGAGFWDRGYGEAGDTLTERAHAFGEINLYAGEDGRLYLS